MPPRVPDRRFRLLALDVDGTLLDPDGDLPHATAAAVGRAAKAGIRPVLCTGRRYRRARPVAERLGLDAPLVCNSGSLVKEPSDHRTLWRADLDAPLLGEILAVFRRLDEPAVSFTDRSPSEPDFLIPSDPTGRPLFDEYVHLNRPHGVVDAAWASGQSSESHFHLCAVGTRAAMLDFERILLEALGDRVRTFVQRSPSYSGTMCEVLHPEASKWSAVLRLAALWDVAAEEICAVGDDMNDVPMIRGAGLGVAMGHAPEAVKAAADRVIDDNRGDGLARLIDDLIPA